MNTKAKKDKNNIRQYYAIIKKHYKYDYNTKKLRNLIYD